MARHQLKIWPEFFEAIVSGKKTFEIRRSDRDFKVDDVLCLSEFMPAINKYTGRTCLVHVTHLDYDLIGMEEGFVIMSVKLDS